MAGESKAELQEHYSLSSILGGLPQTAARLSSRRTKSFGCPRFFTLIFFSKRSKQLRTCFQALGVIPITVNRRSFNVIGTGCYYEIKLRSLRRRYPLNKHS